MRRDAHSVGLKRGDTRRSRRQHVHTHVLQRRPTPPGQREVNGHRDLRLEMEEEEKEKKKKKEEE
jgi:hypothetical protein